MNDMDLEVYEEHYSVYTPGGVLMVHFTQTSRTLTGNEHAIDYFNTMLRMGVTGNDGHTIDQQSFSGEDLLRFIDGQYGLLVVLEPTL